MADPTRAPISVLLVAAALAAACGSPLKSRPDGGRDGATPDGPGTQVDAAACRGLDLPDFDCPYGTPSYVCQPSATGWMWGYTCPESPTDASSGSDAGDGRAVVDVAPLADAVTGCVALPVTSLPDSSLGGCPPTAQSSACGGEDVGAVVARSSACVRSWGDVPFQCGLWPPPAVGEELVVVQLGNCTDVIDGVAAVACAEHIELSYVSRGTCQSCDGTRSKWRVFTLPLDARPVVVTARHVEPPCLPSLLDAATGTGDSGGIDGGCPGTAVGTEAAAESFRAYKFATIPTFNPDASFAAEEVVVSGLWDALRAQLFTGKVSVDGRTHSLCSFLYRECQLESVTGDCGTFGVILSGAVRNGAFYYSWGSGSGAYRSTLGKLAPVAGAWQRTTSIAYFNPGMGPPGMVVAPEGDALLVYRATVGWGVVNEWKNAELIGTLADLGDRLAIVDGEGKEIPSTLP